MSDNGPQVEAPTGNPTIDFAQIKMACNVTWARADEAVKDHEGFLEDLHTVNAEIRATKRQIADRERTLAMEVDPVGDDGKPLSKTALKERVKENITHDPAMISLQGVLDAHEKEKERVQAEMAHAQLVVHATSARLHELGGLFFFYGVAKQNSLQAAPPATQG